MHSLLQKNLKQMNSSINFFDDIDSEDLNDDEEDELQEEL